MSKISRLQEKRIDKLNEKRKEIVNILEGALVHGTNAWIILDRSIEIKFDEFDIKILVNTIESEGIEGEELRIELSCKAELIAIISDLEDYIIDINENMVFLDKKGA